MKKVATFLLTILITNAYSISYAGAPRIFAIVIGIAHYTDASIPDLKYSEKDARDFYNFLKSPLAGAIPESNMVLLIGADATRGNIIRSLVDISKRSTKDDMLIFYFSGHGQADAGDNSGYLLNSDAETDNAPATALSMEEIKSRIDKCRAKLKISYVDACHAGLFTGGKGSQGADNEIIASAFMESVSKADDGNVAFLASSAKQQSQESDKFSNGVFTYYLLKGLNGDADKEQKNADGYNDGLVTVGEMVTYLSNKIPAATKFNQKPTVQGIYDEAFPLSILRSNVLITEEIAKRPDRKTVAHNKPVEASGRNLETATIDLPSGKCKEKDDLYGELYFINNYKEDVLLYFYYDGSFQFPNVLLAKGEKTSFGRIKVADWGNKNRVSRDFKFFFKTVDESKPVKYGTLTFNAEACKAKTYVISNKNLYLSVDGEKH